MDVSVVGVAPNTIEYHEAWAMQRAIHADVAAGRRPDTTLLLEHDPVYTAGKRTRPAERPIDGAPVVDVDRGGKITWHGPGQLVGYPIVRLPNPVDVVDYVRRLEQVLIDVCAHFGVTTYRVAGRSGVWCAATSSQPERKVAAIGVRVSQGVSMHGFALNCDNSLDPYTKIIACGIEDAGVTTLTAEVGRPIGVVDALPVVMHRLESGLFGEHFVLGDHDLPAVTQPAALTLPSSLAAIGVALQGDTAS